MHALASPTKHAHMTNIELTWLSLAFLFSLQLYIYVFGEKRTLMNMTFHIVSLIYLTLTNGYTSFSKETWHLKFFYLRFLDKEYISMEINWNKKHTDDVKNS